MFRTPSKTDQAKDAVAAGADKAAELKVKAGEAATATAAGAVVAKEKAAEAADVARDTAETVKEYAHEAAETLAPKVESARDTFVEDVLPKVASALAAIAAGAAAAKESAAEAAERAPDAYAVLKGDAVAKKGGKGKWILLLGALAAGAAVMAWRRSNERPDPWATAGSYTPPKSTSEKVSEVAEAAKEKAAEVKDAAVEKAGELKAKATDAKDTAGSKASAAKARPAQAHPGAPRVPRPPRPRTRHPTRSTRSRRRARTPPRRPPTPAPPCRRSARAPRAPTCRPPTSTPARSERLVDRLVDRQGLTSTRTSRHRGRRPPLWGGRRPSCPAAGARASERQAVPEGEERVVVARDVLGVRAHLVHRPRQVDGQPPDRRNPPGQRVEQRLVARAVADDDGRREGQQRGQHRRAVEPDVDDEGAHRGDPCQPGHEPGGNSSEPWWNHDSRNRSDRGSKGAVSRTSARSASSGRSTGIAVARQRLLAHVLAEDPQARGERQRAAGIRAVAEDGDRACLRGVPASRKSSRPTVAAAASSST